MKGARGVGMGKVEEGLDWNYDGVILYCSRNLDLNIDTAFIPYQAKYPRPSKGILIKLLLPSMISP